MNKPTYKEYIDYVNRVGHGQLDMVDTTHDGFPLTPKEAKFITEYILTGRLSHSLKEAGLQLKTIAGKDYITDEITYRLEQIKKDSIADADEILQYFTKVMRGEEKDQFGLDAPLSERTSAARELAKRVVDIPNLEEQAQPEIKITLNFEGMDSNGETSNS